MPGVDILRLFSAGEDHTVKVWDLVLNKEVAALKGNIGRCTAIQFTNDLKTVFVGARDGKITLYNTQDKFKQIGQLDLRELGLDEEEVTCMSYIQINQKSSILAVGGSKGQLYLIDLTTLAVIFTETDYIQSELAYLQF